MATTLYDKAKADKLVGANVYVPYRPQRAGKIIEDLGERLAPNPAATIRVVKVKWLDGKVTEQSLHSLNDFDALIEDHRTKLAYHENTLTKLNNLGS